MILCIILSGITLFTFSDLRNHGFINYDDNEFILENEHIRNGFSIDSLTYAFTDINSGIWHPITWLSHILDCQLYGLNPMGHHWNNLIFHILNVLLLFVILQKITGASYRSFFVALLFAIHPIQIESVAWVSERKNVLSTFFYLLCVLSYISYVKEQKFGKYILFILFYILGLMSKPMMVTMPFVLLLLDYWPLGRLKVGEDNGCVNPRPLKGNLTIIIEKIPLLIIAIIFSIISWKSQYTSGAMTELKDIPLFARIELSLVSYMKYLYKIIWPHKLAFYYPYNNNIPMWETIVASLILILISLFSVYYFNKKKYFLFGWLWFLIIIFPVIGLVHLGDQAMADRYMYIPCIGIFIFIVWAGNDLITHLPFNKTISISVCLVITILLSLLSVKQLKTWENNYSLYTHAIAVTENNYVAHGNLGAVLLNSGKTDEAIYHLNKALEIKPQDRKSHFDMGTAMAAKRMYNEAKKHFNVILKSYPDDIETIVMLGRIHFDMEEYEKSIHCFSTILKQNPTHFQALEYLGNNYLRLNRPEMAKKYFLSAIKVHPDSPSILFILGTIFHNEGDLKKAEYYYKMALRYKPDLKEAIINLNNIMIISKSTGIPPQ